MEHLDEDFNDLSYIVFVYNSLRKITTPYNSFHIRSANVLYAITFGKPEEVVEKAQSFYYYICIFFLWVKFCL